MITPIWNEITRNEKTACLFILDEQTKNFALNFHVCGDFLSVFLNWLELNSAEHDSPGSGLGVKSQSWMSACRCVGQYVQWKM